jgi:hypothetical protein
MKIDQALRILAGFMVVLSVVLTEMVSPHFIWLTVFIGVNLFQSGFTKWCPAIWIFQKMGLKS